MLTAGGPGTLKVRVIANNYYTCTLIYERLHAAFSLELSRPKCSLQEISVNVFGRPSRKETFVITVNLPEGMNHIGDDGEADLEVIMASFRKLVRHKGKQLAPFVRHEAIPLRVEHSRR